MYSNSLCKTHPSFRSELHAVKSSGTPRGCSIPGAFAPLPIFHGLCHHLDMFLVDLYGNAGKELGRMEVTVSQDKKGNLSSLS